MQPCRRALLVTYRPRGVWLRTRWYRAARQRRDGGDEEQAEHEAEPWVAGGRERDASDGRADEVAELICRSSRRHHRDSSLRRRLQPEGVAE
jgi:hypothetical protein